MIQRRNKRNSSKINLTISVVFHSALVVLIVFFAAREGMLGKKLKQITVTMVPKEKKPEPPKAKPPEPKVEPPKPAETPKPQVASAPPKTEAPAPPPSDAQPAVAPPPATLSGFEFHDGAHEVQTASDPSQIYKALVERALRSHWTRPEDIDDAQFVAEIDLAIDPAGRCKGYEWRKGSGNTRWDGSVKAALAKTATISRPPPKGFPERVLVRFDVESLKTEDVIQVSTR
jgi:outer membrane biosynthesis protein TonB